jgi:hypothetical protein
MPPFFMRPRGVPEFVTPPAEPSRADLQEAFEEQLACLDDLLTVQANRPAQFRMQEVIDRVLDERLALRRAYPGGAS